MMFKLASVIALLALVCLVHGSMYNKPQCYSNPEEDLKAKGVRLVTYEYTFLNIVQYGRNIYIV